MKDSACRPENPPVAVAHLADHALAPTPALAWAALDALDRGGRIADAAAASGLTTTEVAKIADRAAILARLMTRTRNMADFTATGVRLLDPFARAR